MAQNARARRRVSLIWAPIFGLCALLATFFALVAVIPMILPPPDPEAFGGSQRPSPIFALLLALFFAPMATLLWRATWLVLRASRGKTPLPVLTPVLAWAIALAYGLPGLLAIAYAAISQPSRLADAIYAVPVSLMLLGAPMLAGRLERGRNQRE